MMNTTSTRKLIKFASTLRAQAIPEAVRHKVSLHLLDGLGCGWAASQHYSSEPTIRSARLFGGHGECSVFGYTGFSPLAAAFSNAAVINGLDHDDGVEIDGKGLGHPGATLIAAAMVALDISPTRINHETLITALTVGFEVNNRLINAIQPTVERFNQVYGVAQHQSIGATLVAGLILGLDEQQLHHAVGLAATLTPLPSLHQYNWQQRPLLSIKDAVAPAAQAAVQAAIMAQHNMSGSLDVLDGEHGFWRMIGSDQFIQEILTCSLGSHWYSNYGSFKIYPACRWLACALESMDTLMQETGWLAEDIRSIKVYTFPRIVDYMMDYRPRTVTDAQFSLPWTMAAVAARLAPCADWYSEQNMQNPALLALADKVIAINDPDFSARMTGPARQPGARVELIHANGSRAVQERFKPLGSAERPISESDVIEKVHLNLKGQNVDAEVLLARVMQQNGNDRISYSSALELTAALVK